MKPIKRLFLSFCLFCFLFPSFSQYVVNLSRPGPVISPTMWGLFFEDINRSADGGLYADMVKNRSFDFPEAFSGWLTAPSRALYEKNDIFQIVSQTNVSDRNPKYLQVTPVKNEIIQIANSGFGGITVDKAKQYQLILCYRQPESALKLRVDIINSANKSVAYIIVPTDTATEWKTVKHIISTIESAESGKLLISFEGTGKIDIDRISLFPVDTWKGKEEGLRNDLVLKLFDIKPGFLRFPGGCIVEGADLSTRYQWKNTVGPLNARKLIPNQWKEGGSSGKPMPDYYQSFGLGFMEYFQLCEDINAAPMPIVNCGISCQFGTGEVEQDIKSYIQDALDLIEFANGGAGSIWGKKRIEWGHPKPFGLKLVGIGNENWGPQYVERLKLFQKAIKTRYPEIKLICATGYTPNPQFRYMDSILRKMKVDIIDEHYYQTANWFLMNANKYDNYDRNGPSIFIGEYACHSVRIGNPSNKNTLLCALAEAAWMTGLERNADIVTMAAYAPLFAHVKDWQWTPNLIWFDNRTSYATPSYYVQKLFSLNKGTNVVPITEDGNSIAGIDSIWASAVIDKSENALIIKLVNPSKSAKTKSIALVGIKNQRIVGNVTILDGNLGETNNLEMEVVKPVTRDLEMKTGEVAVQIPAHSLVVYRLKI